MLTTEINPCIRRVFAATAFVCATAFLASCSESEERVDSGKETESDSELSRLLQDRDPAVPISVEELQAKLPNQLPDAFWENVVGSPDREVAEGECEVNTYLTSDSYSCYVTSTRPDDLTSPTGTFHFKLDVGDAWVGDSVKYVPEYDVIQERRESRPGVYFQYWKDGEEDFFPENRDEADGLFGYIEYSGVVIEFDDYDAEYSDRYQESPVPIGKWAVMSTYLQDLGFIY